EQMNQPVLVFEKKLLKFFLIFFFILHVLAIISVPLSSFLTPIEREVSFVVDVLPETAIPAPTTAEEPPATDMLPQLPKKFTVKSEQLPSLPKAATEEDAQDNEPSDEVAAHNDDGNLLKAKDALKRLALERLRSQKLQETKKQRALTKQMHKALLNISSLKNSDAVRSKYQTVLRVFIRRNFILPDIHDLKNADIKVKLEIKINDKGYLSKMRIIQSSNNKIFDELAASAVKNSSPFPTPPRELIEQDIIIILTPLMTS
ncbi:MAG: cell envelope integrity protein TolA, partial [Pseudomonadota bacterium]|nr:cell envelope integrity protein TolA [Pseudomonadota bacterium]